MRNVLVCIAVTLLVITGCNQNVIEESSIVYNVSSDQEIDELSSHVESKYSLISIDERIEFLSGVLSQTSWMDPRGPSGSGNLYF